MPYIKMNQTASAILQSKINQSLVFNFLRENGPTYRSKIAKNLHLSLPAVGRALDELEVSNCVKLLGVRKNEQSRTVPFYDINLENNVIISVDIYNGLITAYSKEGQDLTTSFTLPETGSLEEKLEFLINDYVEKKLNKSKEEISSISLGFPGIVNVKDGYVVKSVYHKEYENIPICKMLRDYYDCPVCIDNVANLAVWQNYCESGQRIKNIVAMDLGMEIGTGLLINGKIYRGESYMAGEIGFYTNDELEKKKESKHSSTLRKLCAKIESFHEGKSVEVKYKGRRHCMEVVSESFAKVHNGDQNETKIVESFVKEIVYLINKIDSLINPALIVISGDICCLPYSKEAFMDKVATQYHSIRFSDVNICFSPSKNHTALKGGMMRALDKYLSIKFPYIMRK